MPVSAPAIQRKSRDRCGGSIAGCTRDGEEQVQPQRDRGGREREHGQEELRPERLAEARAATNHARIGVTASTTVIMPW